MTHCIKIQPMVVPAAARKQAKIYSKLSLQGKWLLDLGFVPGDQVRISNQGSGLLIEKM